MTDTTFRTRQDLPTIFSCSWSLTVISFPEEPHEWPCAWAVDSSESEINFPHGIILHHKILSDLGSAI